MQNLPTSSILDIHSQVFPDQMSFVERMTPQYLGKMYSYNADLIVAAQNSMSEKDFTFTDYPYIGML